jgi:hypothetical protein
MSQGKGDPAASLLFLLLTFRVCLLAMLGSRLGVLLSVGRMFLTLRMIALTMMFSGGAMGFCRTIMMLGCRVVFVSRHGIPPVKFLTGLDQQPAGNLVPPLATQPR